MCIRDRLWFGGNYVNKGSLEIGKIMAFINYLVQIMSSLNMLIMSIINFSRAKVSADRINEVLDVESSIKDREDADKIGKFDVEFKDVYFKYNKDSEYVLKGISSVSYTHLTICNSWSRYCYIKYTRY